MFYALCVYIYVRRFERKNTWEMKVARWTPRRTELSRRRFFALDGAVALVRRVWEDGDFCRDIGVV